MKLAKWLIMFLFLTLEIFAVPNEGHVKHFPNSLCLLDKSEVTWDVYVPDGKDFWVATSGQINGVNISDISSGKHQLPWSELGEFSVSIVINYRCGDLSVTIIRVYQINVYGALKISGPEVVCLTKTGKFKVELCDGENTPTGVNWDITGDGHVVGNGDVQVDVAWNSPSASTNDKTVTARYGTLEASKKLTVIQILSETVFEHPTPRTRTTIGVGEEVKVFVIPSDFSVSWSLDVGDDTGILSSDSGNSTFYTSSKTANIVEIKAKYNGESICPYPIETIEPSGVLMTLSQFIGAGLKRADGNVGAAMETEVYVLPATVNFKNILVSEGEAPAVVEGYFVNRLKPEFTTHPATTKPIKMFDFDTGTNLGTLLNSTDQIAMVVGKENAIDPLNVYPITAGKFIWNIPWKYHYKDMVKEFAIVEQKEEFIILSKTRFQIKLSKGGYQIDPPLIGDPR